VRRPDRPAFARIALLLLLGALAAGCPKPVVVDSFEVGRPLPLDDPAALRVMEAHRARVAQGSALTGLARVALDGPGFKLNRPQRIAVERPRRLRFEVLGLFDVLAGLLVSDGVEYGYYEALTGRVDRGLVTQDLLWELARLDLDPDEVVDLLLAAPVPRRDRAVVGAWREPDFGITLAYATPGSGSTVYFRFDPAGELRELRAVEPGRVTRVKASFEAYGPVEGGTAGRRFPMRIRLESPKVEATALFEWKRIMLADALPDRFFAIPALEDFGG